MKRHQLLTLGLSVLAAGFASAQSSSVHARILALELGGNAQEARRAADQAAQSAPRDAGALEARASYLDTHNSPVARQAYEQLLTVVGNNPAKQQAVLRRLVQLDLIAGDRTAAERHLAEYVAAGAGAAKLPPPGQLVGLPMGVVEIPGPMRSFSRMAALSPDLPADEILLALARNVITNGYQASAGADTLEPTEYLKLVFRYIQQARELARIAGESQTIKIDQCESPQAAEVLKALGMRMRGGCGSDVVLETVNATRAFLSMDSGFPLAELEQALRTNRPFAYDYKPTKVPVLYTPEYWLSSKERVAGDFIDAFLSDPSLCRLYLGLAKLDPETAEEVRKQLPVQRIRAFAHVFDFFGGMFRIRNGKVSPPGGAKSVAAWTELVGASPDQGSIFVEKLVTKDDGWLASYYDSLGRISGPALDYLADPNRLKRNYTALRGRVTSPGPARPVFRANTDLMLLATRLQIGSDGKPVIPGGLEVWKNLFVQNPNGKYDGKLTRSAVTWKEPDDLIEALFGLSRKSVENEPLKIYLAVSDMERGRSKPLERATVEKLVVNFRIYSPQYPLLNESPSVSDATIRQYLDLAIQVQGVRDPGQRSDVAGTLQALTGLWQVFVRNDLIPAAQADSTLAAILTPFPNVKSQRDLFDAGRSGVDVLLKAAGTAPGANVQDRMMDLLAGAATPKDSETHQQLLAEMMKIFEAQKLASLKTMFDLADNTEALAKGEKPNVALMNRLAARLSDLNLPKSTLSSQEKNSFAFGYWTERHIDQQRKLNFRASIEKAGGAPDKLRDLRGQLAPLLRDTLVGMLYIHYAPPGAQVLYTNPLFARSHDFIGVQGGTGQTWKGTEVLGSGWPSSAGGRLVGSLSLLPYALAEAEQNFLIPTREQALIWGDLVPQMLVSSKLPRWWNVTPAQLRYVALNLKQGESVVADAAISPDVRAKLVDALDRLAPPARARRVSDSLEVGNVTAALEQITPSELYQIGLQAQRLEPAPVFTEEIRMVAAAAPQQCTEAAISSAFGTPKPTLSNSLRPQLLNLRTFPTLMGYSSRILAESWESNNIYFAALADEIGASPSQLNVLLPDWTQKTVEQIFATHLEDWPALLRSMRATADQVRQQSRRAQAAQDRATTGAN